MLPGNAKDFKDNIDKKTVVVLIVGILIGVVYVDGIPLSYSKVQFTENNYTHYSGSAAWLKENETLFSRANWFMIDPDKQSKGYLLPETACYNWVEERLKKDPTW